MYENINLGNKPAMEVINYLTKGYPYKHMRKKKELVRSDTWFNSIFSVS